MESRFGGHATDKEIHDQEACHLVENVGTGDEEPDSWRECVAAQQRQQEANQQGLFQLFADQQHILIDQTAALQMQTNTRLPEQVLKSLSQVSTGAP